MLVRALVRNLILYIIVVRVNKVSAVISCIGPIKISLGVLFYNYIVIGTFSHTAASVCLNTFLSGTPDRQILFVHLLMRTGMKIRATFPLGTCLNFTKFSPKNISGFKVDLNDALHFRQRKSLRL